MFNKAETILNPLFLGLGILFLLLFIIRFRSAFFKRKHRMFFWNMDLKKVYRISSPIKAASIFFLIPGIIYFLFVILIFTAVVNEHIKAFFITIFFIWGVFESYLALSVPIKLYTSSTFRKLVHFLLIIVCIAGVVFLIPKIVQSYPFPDESECVLLDVPVRGTWLVGHAGATEITNTHSANRYAIDCLKLGPDGRFYKEDENEVTDFYSYAEPVFAPAEGIITYLIDSLTSDVMGKRDKDRPGGNLVILDIGNGKYFYLGHLMKGSIPVKIGDTVAAGDILGYLGNSGNTYFPHLHMHVQNMPTPDYEGRITYPFRFNKIKRKRLGLWLTIDNAALIRNDRFTWL